jgi:hypothetical protein
MTTTSSLSPHHPLLWSSPLHRLRRLLPKNSNVGIRAAPRHSSSHLSLCCIASGIRRSTSSPAPSPIVSSASSKAKRCGATFAPCIVASRTTSVRFATSAFHSYPIWSRTSGTGTPKRYVSAIGRSRHATTQASANRRVRNNNESFYWLTNYVQFSVCAIQRPSLTLYDGSPLARRSRQERTRRP